MPVVSDPKFVWPPDVSPVVGPDGVLSARVDVAHAGVLLAADFADEATPTRTNLFDNPSFETEGIIAGFGIGGGATVERSQEWADTGSWSLKITPNGSSTASAVYVLQGGNGTTNQYGLLPGRTYTISAMVHSVKVPTTFSTANRWIINVGYYDTGGSVHWMLGSITQPPAEVGTFSASTTFTVPDDSDHVTVRLMNGASDADCPVYWDSLLIEESDTAGAYFDGSTPADDTFTYAWSGTEFGSSSIATRKQSATVQKVRFERDGQPVRSGNPAYAPGGIAVAYDHEAPLGQGVSYQAVPIMADGSEGEPSDVITLEVDAPVRQTWLKSVNEPDLSIGSTEGSVANPIIVAPVDLTSAGRVETTSIQGSRFPAATWDTHEAAGGDMSVLVYTVKDRDRVIALLDSGPVLVQPARNTGIGQFYCLAGDVQQSIKTYRQSVPVTELSFPVTAVDCPSTVDTPLMIPGLSYQSVAESYSTYKELGQQVPSYLALVGVDWL